MNNSLQDLRRDYGVGGLDESMLPSHPHELLQKWLDQAFERQIPDANAMDLATIDDAGYPVSRIVLLRGLKEDGLQFFTNYQSAKGQQLAQNPAASVNFFWRELERQVRIRGTVAKTKPDLSDAYFASRPRESQVSAWASPQSRLLQGGRAELEALVRQKFEEFAKLDQVPRPAFWGGFELRPDQFEFWQGRPSRLHDRLTCRKVGGVWTWQRLAP